MSLSVRLRPQPHARRWPRLLGACVVLAAVAIVIAALVPSGSDKQPFGHLAIAPKSASSDQIDVHRHVDGVVGTNVPAKVYGSEIAALEDRGTDLSGRLISDLSPLPPAAFTAPERSYRAYALGWAARAGGAVAVLRRALVAGDRPAARRDWTVAWSDYLHLGAVYGLFGSLDQAIDGQPGVLPGGTASPHFTGLHRIELGLWTGAPLRALVPYADRLRGSLAQLRHVVPTAPIAPLDYATRAHEILEDAQRDFLSGTDVPWSGQGVAGTAAGLAATNEVVGTLAPLLTGRDNTLVQVDYELRLLGGVLASIRRDHGGTLPALSGLSRSEQERLNGTLAGALGALSQLPGTLETTSLVVIPKLPASAGDADVDASDEGSGSR